MLLDVSDTQYLSIPDLLKATPAEEGGRRFVYLEASNEALDQQGEVVLAKALAESASYFLRYGNLDLDHLTQLGPKAGVKDYALYEIGRPADVRVDGPRTFVKGEIYQGSGQVAEKANQFWDSLTAVKPPQRWYPSVGGSVLEKAQDQNSTVIRKVRWTNIGFSKTPVNQTVPTVATVPFGPLAKCWGAGGLDLNKALEAGSGTDSATLTGGAALRGQSLDRKVHSYWDFRDRLAGDVNAARVHPTAKRLIEHATTHYGLTQAEAAEWTERFLADLRDGLNKRKR